jgi:hypothetical protein
MPCRVSVLLACGAMFVGSIGTLDGVRAQQPAQAEPVQAEQVQAEQVQFFEKHIRPILVKECYSCHSADSEEIEGGLTLDTREGIRKGGERGAAVVPGDVRRSLLIEAIRHQDEDLAMPPDKRLAEEVVKHFEKWIAMGAVDPRDGKPPVAEHYAIDIEKGREFWSFQPPKETSPPAVKDAAWPRTDVDRYLLAAMEAKNLKPVEDADARTFLRRLYFDLLGLPPSPEEVAEFAARHAEDAQAAIGEVVDRLLESPRFGERWARHWLDVARYAESTGKTVNFYYPQAWRYRDYVIAAFNTDKPYDEFILEQLAGDLMPSDDPHVTAERMIATGFLAIGPKTLNERNGLKYELDMVDEQIDVTTQAFLGITVACARCHDHKFDPIPQADYYALAGIFRSTETCYGTVRYINAQRAAPLIPLPADARVAVTGAKLTERERERIESQIQGVRDSIKNMKDGVQQFFAAGRISLLQARLDAFDADGNPKLLAMGVRDKPPARAFGSRRGRFGGFAGFTYDGSRTIGDSPVYLRGEPDRPGPAPVPRGTLQVMTTKPLEFASTSSGRLEFAQWVASRENPLAARVMANRVWLKLFGRGLVPTADDFGSAGRPPTHPELLDYLAIRFMQDGWSVKRLVKLLVTSRVYQLGSTANSVAMEVDPDNRLLWRTAPRRLDAECLRDAMLAVSGQLDTTPPVGSVVAESGEGPVTQFFVRRDSPLAAVNDPRNVHRSIYLPILRDNLSEALALFDAADPSLITTDRPQTTVASQGLFLLNNEFVMRAADAAADGLIRKDGETERIHEAFVRFFSRQPMAHEQAGAEAFLAAYGARLKEQRMSESRQQRELWSTFCQALFASAEFQYRK